MSTSSTSSNPPRKCNNVTSPHGPLSVRKLLSLKIIDKRSCYVTGLRKDIANEKTLEQDRYFGQFGDLLSIRIIRNTNPMGAYVRFKEEKSAKSAILWSNNTTTKMIAAEHGYHRYCIKFINHKECKKPKCPNRHSWCTPMDYIIVKNKTYRASDKNIPFYKSSKNANSNSRKEAKSSTSTRSNTTPTPASSQNSQNSSQNSLHNSSSNEEMEVLQSQFNVLQCQYNQQNHFIKSLLQQLQQLRSENQSMKREYSSMSQYLEMAQFKQQNNDDLEIHAIVDSIVRDEFQGPISSISDTPSSN